MSAKKWSVFGGQSAPTERLAQSGWSVAISNFQFRISIFLLLALAPISCVNKERGSAAMTEYTCPMHLDVIQSSPGKCPVCGMDLVLKGQTTQHAGLMLTDSQMLLANITTRKVALESIGEASILNATLALDQEGSEVISSRVAGRIEKLYIKETGRVVRAGEPIVELYSEALLTQQREFLLALEQAAQLGKTEPRYETFAKSARKKLLLYGLTEGQVDALARTRQLQNKVTFLAPRGGQIKAITVTEGQYVEEGAPIYQLEDIGRLWVEAELYPGETALISAGDAVTVKITGAEYAPIEARVTFVSPEYKGNSQITRVRASIANPKLEFKPGMQAQVYVTHSSHRALAVPTDAVIREQAGNHVYVQSATNTFERRAVTLGVEETDRVEITGGLREGDIVVVTGAYLIYSEQVLKGH